MDGESAGDERALKLVGDLFAGGGRIGREGGRAERAAGGGDQADPGHPAPRRRRPAHGPVEGHVDRQRPGVRGSCAAAGTREQRLGGAARARAPCRDGVRGIEPLRPVEVVSKGDGREGWRMVLDREAFEGSHEVEVEKVAAPTLGAKGMMILHSVDPDGARAAAPGGQGRGQRDQAATCTWAGRPWGWPRTWRRSRYTPRPTRGCATT